MSALYKRFGLSKKSICTHGEIERLKRIPQIMQRRSRDIPIYKGELVSTAYWIAINKYYADKHKEATKYAHLMIEHATEYFFGSWRYEAAIDGQPPDAEKRKKYGAWSDEFRKSIFWASCLGDWDSVRKLAEYPTDECPVGRYEPKMFCYWLLLLAGVLRGESFKSLKRHTDKLHRSKKTYYILLLNMLHAVLDKKAAKFNEVLTEYLDYCNENTFNRPEIDEKVSTDGTFLINFACDKSLCVNIPEEYIDRIVVLNNPVSGAKPRSPSSKK
jgi:hypothetical protein